VVIVLVVVLTVISSSAVYEPALLVQKRDVGDKQTGERAQPRAG
jgi:hypothetical protein